MAESSVAGSQVWSLLEHGDIVIIIIIIIIII